METASVVSDPFRYPHPSHILADGGWCQECGRASVHYLSVPCGMAKTEGGESSPPVYLSGLIAADLARAVSNHALAQPISATLNERGARYGTFTDNARIAQDLKSVVRTAGKWSEMAADQQEAVDMILSKISRLTTGDSDYLDNWHDIIGYAQLVEERLKGDRP